MCLCRYIELSFQFFLLVFFLMVLMSRTHFSLVLKSTNVTSPYFYTSCDILAASSFSLIAVYIVEEVKVMKTMHF